SSSYWDIVFALVDANTKSMPASLAFDPEERLFIDLGCLPGVINLSAKFDPKSWLASKCAGDIFPVMTFSDYIAEAWAAITGNPAPVPVIGMSLNDRINTLNEALFNAQGQRDDFINSLAAKYPSNINITQLLQTMDEFLISAMKVNMRVPEYREGDEPTRQKLAQQRKAYLDAEKSIQLFVSSAQKNEANPLPIPQAEKFTALHDKTKIIAREILYSQIDAVKIARRTKKITDACAQITDQMKRAELRNTLTKKREYLTVPAKNARCDMSLIAQPDSMPLDYAKDYEIVREFTAMDIEMFNVPRVRMYGIPRIIFVPGQGLGTYDWSDNSLLIPAFPVGGNDKSVSYAIGTFRWDSDEDRKLKTPYEQQIKENRKKSLLVLAASFCKDYSLWLTKEKRGYRILPRETHKVFVNMFRPQADE
ncbi:MAG: hypothetical protein IJ587_13275, partial [Synergistaceae bacterium]|nr:hypothetical protein [Synergistaceae bacterium]